MRRLSETSFNQSRALVHRLSGALGLTDSAENVLHWQCSLLQRARSGRIGIQTSDTAIPKGVEKLIEQAEKTLREISDCPAQRANPLAEGGLSPSITMTDSNPNFASSIIGIESNDQGYTHNHEALALKRWVSPANSSHMLDLSSSHGDLQTGDDARTNQTLNPYYKAASSPGLCQTVSHEELFYGEAARSEYKEYIEMEQLLCQREVDSRFEGLENDILEQRGQLDKTLEMITEHYCGRYGNENIRRERHSGQTVDLQRGSSRPHVRRALENIPTFTPWVTYIYALVQIVSVIVLCAVGGLAPVGIEPVLRLHHGIQTLRGREAAESWVNPNLWIGPSPEFLIKSGAVYAPCMRRDIWVMGQVNGLALGTAEDRIGCCEMVARRTVSAATEQECAGLTRGVGRWSAGAPCSVSSVRGAVLQTVLEPCCVGHRGRCEMATPDHCHFMGGVVVSNSAGGNVSHCSQIDCLSILCGSQRAVVKHHEYDDLNSTDAPGYFTAMTESTPTQHWRLLVAMVLPPGVLVAGLSLFLLYGIGRQVEAAVGWPRAGLIYVMSSVGGFMIGAAFTPYIPHCGGMSAGAGLLGVTAVEIIHSWSIITAPWREVLKLTAVIALLALLGTLPLIDNFELLGGMIIGVLSAVLLLPYVTFSRSRMISRRVLVVIITPVLVIVLAMTAHMLYIAQSMSELCPSCSLLNCLPYTQNMCNFTRPPVWS